tara:strand:+ start:3839 stop:4111 length:273 start_codon:yes stop_codon:yes gene_type:complete
MLKADGFDEAIIGTGLKWTENGSVDVLVYDADKCVEILMERDDMEYDEAVEFFEFNTVGSYMGETTPIFTWKEDFKELEERLNSIDESTD